MAGENSLMDDVRSHDITIANYHGYRVIRIFESRGIHFRNVPADSNRAMAICTIPGCRKHVRSSKVSFEDCIYDNRLHTAVRDREFAWLDVTGRLHHVTLSQLFTKNLTTREQF